MSKCFLFFTTQTDSLKNSCGSTRTKLLYYTNFEKMSQHKIRYKVEARCHILHATTLVAKSSERNLLQVLQYMNRTRPRGHISPGMRPGPGTEKFSTPGPGPGQGSKLFPSCAWAEAGVIENNEDRGWSRDRVSTFRCLQFPFMYWIRGSNSSFNIMIPLPFKNLTRPNQVRP